MGEDTDLEDRLNKVEDELANPANQPRTGQIIVRMFRFWLEKHWEPHNRAEQEFRGRIDRYLWSLRFAVAAVAAMGGAMAWALSTMIDAISILRIGTGGP